MDRIFETSVDHLVHDNDFELYDFIDEANFEQFIDLIRGKNDDQINEFDCDHINGLLADNQFGPTPEDLFDFSANCTAFTTAPGTNGGSIVSPLPGFNVNMNGGGGEEENNGENSSGTTTTMSATTRMIRKQPDRSRTLISERKRRCRMKEKLYELRSLVPNITKMDKTSIIGDAVLYVQELQLQAKKLKSEIANLEASLTGSKSIKIGSNDHPTCKKIIQMDVFEVEERGYYVKLVCNKGRGVAISLFRAVESLTNFKVQSCNLATTSERFVLIFTLNVVESEQVMNLTNLRLWITGALLNQGFEFPKFLAAQCHTTF